MVNRREAVVTVRNLIAVYRDVPIADQRVAGNAEATFGRMNDDRIRRRAKFSRTRRAGAAASAARASAEKTVGAGVAVTRSWARAISGPGTNGTGHTAASQLIRKGNW